MELSIGWIIFVTFIFILIYFIFKSDFTIWSSQNIPGPRPYPVIGNFLAYINPGIRACDMKWIDKYGDIVGIYDGSQPTLIVRDTELLKQVLVKDFDNFTNRRSFTTGSISDYFLLSLRDENWKRVRAAISPAFSANKLKSMNIGLNDCCKLFIENLHELSNENIDVEIDEISGSFTLDLIAKTGFGIDINTQKEKDKSPFVKNAKRLFNQNLFALPLFLILIFFPKLGVFLIKTFNLSFFPSGTIEFFTNVVEQATMARSMSDDDHNDLLQIMISAKIDEDKSLHTDINNTEKESKNKLTKNELIAQGILFILAGWDTVSSSLAMFLHCLADNPIYQEKVFEEIDKVICADDDIDYETLMKLPYFSMCIEESLRLYPPASRVDRMVTKSTGVNLGSIHLPLNSAVVIPILSIHHNPSIYSEPETYIPERFSTEEKANRSSIHFMPFGYGPRNCIAQRLALVQMKIAAIHVIRNFRLSVGEKTKRPISFKNDGRNHVQGGLYLKLVSRI